MSKVDEGLLEVTPKEFDELIDKLQLYLPGSATIHGALMTRKVFKGMSEVYETKIHHSNNSSLVVATPIYSLKEIQSMAIFWDTKAEDESDVVRLLLTIPKIDWTQPIFIGRTPIIVLEKMQMMVERGALGEGFLRSHGICKGTYLHSINESPDEPSLPKGLELRPVTEDHARFTFSHWKYNFFETFENYKALLRVAPGIGIFKNCKINSSSINGNKNRNPTALGDLKEGHLAHHVINDCGTTTNNKSKNDEDAIDNYENGSKDQPNSECIFTKEEEPHSEDQPIAWTLLNQFNLITNTFTLEEYRRNKLATIATTAMIKRALQETGYVMTSIVDDNLISVKLHEKMGFVKHHVVGFQYYSSLNPDCAINESISKLVSEHSSTAENN